MSNDNESGNFESNFQQFFAGFADVESWAGHRSTALAAVRTYNSYDFNPYGSGTTENKMPDGSIVMANADGRIVSVKYQSGVLVTRLPQYCLVKGGDKHLYVNTTSCGWQRWD